ncbi:hypothetical protein I7I50_06584 [Histoplasma capsulatum G186AR]|uniref:Uncharacterized protein n=1 Tax=Ajellomyces capsulatus TaxID=5037 RepID=A0A8H8D337_AJECA|nr:hypothetical protein I7I52_10344 [Histoplasma capsulatum]QSS67486.1 hypothetical protein I7I50_06584 [Histoplasma capsulatum G186AR]
MPHNALFGRCTCPSLDRPAHAHLVPPQLIPPLCTLEGGKNKQLNLEWNRIDRFRVKHISYDTAPNKPRHHLTWSHLIPQIIVPEIHSQPYYIRRPDPGRCCFQANICYVCKRAGKKNERKMKRKTNEQEMAGDKPRDSLVHSFLLFSSFVFSWAAYCAAAS